MAKKSRITVKLMERLKAEGLHHRVRRCGPVGRFMELQLSGDTPAHERYRIYRLVGLSIRESTPGRHQRAPAQNRTPKREGGPRGGTPKSITDAA